MKTKIVFDMDDILWDLNEVTTKKAGVPYDSIICFDISENPILSEQEKDAMRAAYSLSDIFDNIHWYDGVSDLFSLETDEIEVFINSNCLGDTVVVKKLDELHKAFPDVSDDKFILNDIKKGSRKNIGNDVAIFIDDSPKNHLMNKATYHIMMNKPWNTSDWALDVLGDFNNSIIRCDSFDEIICVIKKILKEF